MEINLEDLRIGIKDVWLPVTALNVKEGRIGSIVLKGKMPPILKDVFYNLSIQNTENGKGVMVKCRREVESFWLPYIHNKIKYVLVGDIFLEDLF